MYINKYTATNNLLKKIEQISKIRKKTQPRNPKEKPCDPYSQGNIRSLTILKSDI